MASTTTVPPTPPHILPALHLPSPTISPSSSAENLFLYTQSRPGPTTSHYRPFTAYYSQPPSASTSTSSLSGSSPSPPKSSRASARPSSSISFSQLDDMGFKDKDRRQRLKVSDIHVVRPGSPTLSTIHKTDRPASRSRFTLKGIKKKKSLLSLLSLVSDATSSPSHSSFSTIDSSHHSAPHRPSPTDSPIPLCESPADDKSDKRHGTLKEDEEEDDYGETVKFIPKDVWLKRQSMQIHPYPLDAPYMQAYDPVLLDNDRHTDILLRRLNLNGSPSFHDYGKKPPSTVLDLGCGPGHWLLEAASAWKHSKVTGFDLVDVTLSALEETENIEFVRGNFLKYNLPFPNNSFDLVRMANLSLCIPYDKWQFIFSEAYRVLTVGGRLELIDDQIFFPYGKTPVSRAAPVSPTTPVGQIQYSPPQPSSAFDFDDENEYDDDDNDTLEGEEEYLDTASTLVGDNDSFFPHYSSDMSKQSLASDLTYEEFSHLSSHPSRPAPEPPISGTSLWEQQSTASKDVESVFESMLNRKFSIHSRPSEFVLDLMKRVFGKRHASKIKSMHLKLAPSDPYCGSPDGSEKEASDKGSMKSVDSAGGKKPWITIEWDKKEKKPKDHGGQSPDGDRRSSGESVATPAQIPEHLSAKAAGRLGITYSALAAATGYVHSRPGSPSSITNLSAPSQSPGLILWPSTFIPIPPAEIEMHACKHMHALLGCKPALAEYVEGFKDKNGERIVTEGAFHESIWDYECFRRQRFNWPSELPETHTETEPPSERATPTSKSAPFHGHFEFPGHSRVNSDPVCLPYTDKLTHVRTLRVFEAVKVSDDALV